MMLVRTSTTVVLSLNLALLLTCVLFAAIDGNRGEGGNEVVLRPTERQERECPGRSLREAQ